MATVLPPVVVAVLGALALGGCASAPGGAGGAATAPARSPSTSASHVAIANFHPAGDDAASRSLRTSASPSIAAASLTCRASSISIAPADATEVGGIEQEHVIAVVLRNTGSAVCRLNGYPTPIFTDAHGTRLSLRVTHHGEYVPRNQAGPVLLAPGGRGYAYFARQRCTGQSRAQSTGLSVLLPGQKRPLPVLAGKATPALEAMEQCARGDVANTVQVSSIRSTLRLVG